MLEIVIAVGTVFALLTCVLFYYSSAHTAVKASALTVLVLMGVFTYDHYVKNLATPVTGYPTVKFSYVHYIIQGTDIVLWIRELESGKNKLYRFPYDREAAKELAKAQQGQMKGQEMAGEFEKSNKPNPGLELDNIVILNPPIPKQN